MPTWDIFRIKRGDNSVVTTCHTRAEALQWLEYHKKLVTPDMFIVDIKGTILHTLPNLEPRRPQPKPVIVPAPKALPTLNERRPQW